MDSLILIGLFFLYSIGIDSRKNHSLSHGPSCKSIVFPIQILCFEAGGHLGSIRAHTPHPRAALLLCAEEVEAWLLLNGKQKTSIYSWQRTGIHV